MATLRNDTVIKNADGQATSAIITAANIVNHAAGKISSSDTRSVVTTPQTINSGTVFDFKQNSTESLSDGGSYFGQMTFRPYGTSTDWSGTLSHQLGFADSGNIWQRSGSSTTWGAWKKILNSSNYSGYALPLSGGTLTGGLSGTTAAFSGQITNTIATGTAPFAITSTTLVSNLNVQYLNGQLGSYYAAASSLASYLPLAGGTLTGTLSGTTASFSTKVLSSKFHDSGDTFLFRSGSGSGTTRHINLADTNSDPSNSDGGTGITWGERSDNNAYYLIYPRRYDNGYSLNSRLTIAWYTGIDIGANFAHGGTRFFNSSPFTGTEIFSVGKGDSNVRVVNTLYIGGNTALHAGNYTSYPDATKLPLTGGTMTGTITGVSDSTISFNGGTCAAASYNYILSGGNDGGNKLVVFVNGSTRTADGGVNALTIRNDGGTFVLGIASYLTSILGSSVTINGNAALTSASTLTAGNLSGTIPSGVLGNSTHYIGTTAITLNRALASQTLTGVSIDGNAATVGSVSKVQLFNNTGIGHGTYTTFAALPDFGFYFMQGQNVADAPAAQAANQYYVVSMGLGNEYSYSSYAKQIALPRITVGGGNNYLWIRERESTTWGSWGKVYAGYADTAGNASTVTTNANLTGHITSVGNATSLGSFTSAQLLAALTDETGTGANVFATSPTLVTPILGTPSSGNLANCTFPTLNQNTTGNAATATNVAWTGITGGARTNYLLEFQPPANSYAGFAFKTSAAGEAGYFLVKGTADGDVYTAEGITLVADAGWLTLAQRTTASRGVRIMTGTSSAERLKITTAGDVQIVNGNSFTYNSNVVLHAGNYTSYPDATKLPLSGGSMTGYIIGAVSGLWNTYNSGSFTAYGNATNPALISFHRPNYFATNLGLDTDGVMKIGGWSLGGPWPILHSNNFNTYALPLSGGTLTGGLSGTTGTFSGTLTASGDLTILNLIGSYQNTSVYNSANTLSTTPSRGIRAQSSSIQFTDSYAIAPYYTYRTTGDWPIPYGIGWGTGGESSGIFQRYAANGYSFGDMVFYTGNDSYGAFSFRRHTWEGTTYFAAGSHHLDTELFRIDWAGKATATSFALSGGFTITHPGSGYAEFSNWVLLGTTGFYSSTNSAHLHPNTGTFGSWKITGTRGGWGGIEFESGVSLMVNSNQVGFHRNGYGWQLWWSAGTAYCHKGDPGGGTQATILDSSNVASYALPIGGGTLTGALSGTTASFSGAITQGGNQVLHAGNFATYALPLNPDGDGVCVAYSDENPTFNGVSVGGGWYFGADGSTTGGGLTAKILNAFGGGVNSTNGYYVGNNNFLANSSTTTTTLCIDGSNNHFANELTISGQGMGAYNLMKYSGIRSGDWQTFTNTEGQLNVIQVNNITSGAHTNYPTGVYGYGAVMSWRTNSHSFQLYAAHTGDLAYKTQWGNDNYSGWRRILDSTNYPYAAAMNQNVGTSNSPTFASLLITSEIVIQKDNARNLVIQGSGGADCGLLGRGSSGQFAFQLYGNNNSEYGFLNSAWGGWDLRKVPSGSLFLNGNVTYYLNPASATNLYSLTVANTISGSITGNAGGSSASCTGNAASASYANEIIITNLGTATVSINNGRTAIYRNENGLGAALAYSPVLHAGAGDTMWQVQGTYGSSGNGTFYFRQGYQGVFGNWLTMLSSANYSSYALPLSGGTLTGALSGTTASFSGAITQGGNQVLHAGNVATYALPIGGGTITGNRPLTIDSGGGGIYIKGDTGGWGMGYYFNGSSGTYKGGFGALGGGDTLTNFWVGPAYNNTWMTFSSSANNSQVALQQGGNQVLHAGNFSSYALPYTGGTLTGSITATNHIGPGTGLTGTATSLNIGGNAASASSLAADTSTRFKILTFTGVGGDSGNGAVPDSYAIYQQGGSWTHPYPDLCIGYHTGIKIGAYYGYGGTRFYNNSDWGTEIFSVGNGDNNVRVVNTIYAAAFSGPLTGNVTGNLTGNVTGNVTGSSGSCTGNSVTATSATFLNSSNYIQRIGSSGNYNTDFQNTPAGSVRHQGDDYAITNNPGGSWWFVDNYRHYNSSNYWGTQVAWGWEDNANRLATRNITGNSFGAWVYYLNSANYNSYSPTLGGTGATGNWNINAVNITAYTINQSVGTGNSPSFTGLSVINNITGNITGSAASISGFNNPTTAATVNTIVYRDSGGDIYGRYLFGSYVNSSDDTSSTGLTYIMAKFGDNYHRSASAAKVATFISGQTMDINGSSTSCSGSAASAGALNTNNDYTVASLTSNGFVYSGSSAGSTGAFYFNSSSHGIRRASGTNDVYCYTTSGTLYLGAGGSSTTHVRVTSGGDVGIGVSPSYKLDVNGNIHATAFPASSDIRFKKNITPLENSLEKVKKLQGVRYEWNEFINSVRDGYKLNVPIIGLIAQDVEKIVPEIIELWRLSDDCQDARSIDYPRLIPVLIEAIKEQQIIIENQNQKIENLISRVSALETK